MGHRCRIQNGSNFNAVSHESPDCRFASGSNTQNKGVSTAEKLYENLESRLDNIIYRMGLGASRRATRQMVSHGHFVVNNHRVTIPSYELKSGDIVKIREGSKTKKIFQNLADRLKDYNSPSWVVFDPNSMEGRILDKPKNVEIFLDLNAVLEFYSR